MERIRPFGPSSLTASAFTAKHRVWIIEEEAATKTTALLHKMSRAQSEGSFTSINVYCYCKSLLTLSSVIEQRPAPPAALGVILENVCSSLARATTTMPSNSPTRSGICAVMSRGLGSNLTMLTHDALWKTTTKMMVRPIDRMRRPLLARKRLDKDD